ncbi:MAG: hypothetical protein BWY42_01804 [Candidatus Omnitrophica bacterium ADurb.Bin277]|nr:MAG: hypothetical protein BWY42_01804 [Candidatus Omnitrophica bacterium ADurb.Bin277]
MLLNLNPADTFVHVPGGFRKRINGRVPLRQSAFNIHRVILVRIGSVRELKNGIDPVKKGFAVRK